MNVAGKDAGPRPVWIDTDPAVGLPGRDVDDGYAILQALGSPELAVAAISTVFGNASRPEADRIAAELLRLADASSIPLHPGADGPGHRALTAASRALAEALARAPLTILALGPLTNIAATLHAHPELSAQIERLVFVGGRRPGQRFTIGDRGPLGDFNVECDPAACAEVLRHDMPLVLAGFEVSTHATLTRTHLDRLRSGPPAARWLADHSEDWLRMWSDELDHDGFHPFDTLAVAAVATPEQIRLESLSAALVAADHPPPGDVELHAASSIPTGRPVDYAASSERGFVEDLMARLGVCAAT